MFGEESLLGTFDLTIDEKNRITIPASTKREIGEKLVITKDSDLDIYKIFSESKIIEKKENLEQKIKNAKTKKEALLYKREFLKLFEQNITEAKVNSQGKINLGKNFKEYKTATLIGAYDHLILKLKK